MQTDLVVGVGDWLLIVFWSVANCVATYCMKRLLELYCFNKDSLGINVSHFCKKSASPIGNYNYYNFMAFSSLAMWIVNDAKNWKWIWMKIVAMMCLFAALWVGRCM